MTQIETTLGLTNVFKRLAFSFLCKGLGKHSITHDVYDMVEVSELYPWMPNPEQNDEYGAGVRVAFYRKGERLRWVEFGIRHVGGGGDPAVFLVK
jgi:hypothetical protein